MWIEIFIILILTHFASDWFFTLYRWSIRKRKNWKPRLYHSIQYALIFLPVLLILKLNFLWLFYLFITHFIIDSYKIVENWNKIQCFKEKAKMPLYMQIVQDQILHILLLIPIAI